MYRTDKLRRIRRQKNLSIYEMAEYLKITPAYYSQLENKRRRLFYDLAIKIAGIFCLHPDDLFYPEGR